MSKLVVILDEALYSDSILTMLRESVIGKGGKHYQNVKNETV